MIVVRDGTGQRGDDLPGVVTLSGLEQRLPEFRGQAPQEKLPVIDCLTPVNGGDGPVNCPENGSNAGGVLRTTSGFRDVGNVPVEKVSQFYRISRVGRGLRAARKVNWLPLRVRTLECLREYPLCPVPHRLVGTKQVSHLPRPQLGFSPSGGTSGCFF